MDMMSSLRMWNHSPLRTPIALGGFGARSDIVFPQPQADVVIEILFRPEHAGQRLPHDKGPVGVLQYGWRSDALVEFVGLLETLLENLSKSSNGLEGRLPEALRQSQTDGLGFARGPPSGSSGRRPWSPCTPD